MTVPRYSGSDRQSVRQSDGEVDRPTSATSTLTGTNSSQHLQHQFLLAPGDISDLPLKIFLAGVVMSDIQEWISNSTCNTFVYWLRWTKAPDTPETISARSTTTYM